MAKVAGVSYATVSRALNNYPQINRYTKLKIMKIAEEMGYSPNAIARGLVQKNTKMIALLIPDITNPFYPEVARGVEEYARNNGYCVVLCNTDWSETNEQKYLRVMNERRVDGIIIAPVAEDINKNVQKYRNDIPIVYVGSKIDDNNASFVVIDDFKAMYIATEYLIKLGHSNIMFIGGFENSISHKNRVSGYMQALTEHGLKSEINKGKGNSFKRESGYSTILELIKTRKVPSAIVAENDIVALGIIEAAEKYGYEVPGDISVIGVDDIEYASLPGINLTTVAQPKYDIGSQAAHILLDIIKGVSIPKQVILEPFLIVRGTCRKA